MDFVGPKPYSTKNEHLLVMIDEFSRFPFVFPCPDTSLKSVIDCCQQLFFLFRAPTLMHSDRAQCFLSHDVKDLMFHNGVLLTHSTPYHPTGNSQCEQANGTIWRAVLLALRSQKLPESSWEAVLPSILKAIRSMLCTVTNCTPHERLFQYRRNSSSGYTLTQWLSSPGKILVRKFIRHSKWDPHVEPAKLIEANLSFSKICYSNGREATVSTGDLANPGQSQQKVFPVDPSVVSSEEELHPVQMNNSNDVAPDKGNDDVNYFE